MGTMKHVVKLSDEERNTLEWLISTGEHKADDTTRVRILPKVDDVLTDAQICEHVGCSIATPYTCGICELFRSMFPPPSATASSAAY